MESGGKMAWGLLNGVMAGALWGVVFLAPSLTADFSALQLAVGRYLLYGLVAWMLLLPLWSGLRGTMDRRAWYALFRLSLLGNLVYFVLLATAVHWAGGAAAALIVGMVPVVVALVEARRPEGMPFVRLAPALLACMVGAVLVAWVALDGEHGGQGSTLLWQRVVGVLCAFGALLAWAAYSIANVGWMQCYPSISGHAWSLLTGVATGLLSLLLLPAAMWLGPMAQGGAQWLTFFGVCLALAVGASIVGNACWNRATRILPLSLGGQLIVFETLFALLYGFVWRQRGPTVLEVVAMSLLLGGVVMAARAHARWGVVE